MRGEALSVLSLEGRYQLGQRQIERDKKRYQ